MYANILNVIDDLLGDLGYEKYIYEIPNDKYGLVLDETGTQGKVNSFDGYCGCVSSTINMYMRRSNVDEQAEYMQNDLKAAYNKIHKNKGKTFDNFKLLYVDYPSISSLMRDKNGNFVRSLTFTLIYKQDIE